MVGDPSDKRLQIKHIFFSKRMTKKVVQHTDSKSYFELKRQQTLAGFLTLGLRNANLHVTLETSGRVVVQALSGL